MSLQGDLLHYASLLDRAPSAIANDVLEEAFMAVKANQPGRPMIVLDTIRRALGMDAQRQLRDEYHRVLFSTPPSEVARAGERARATMHGGTRPALSLRWKKAKEGWRPYSELQVALFGCFQAMITEEIGLLHETDLMGKAAAEIYDPAAIQAQDFFKVMPNTTDLYNRAYRLFLEDHLAREIVRETPRHLLSAL